MCILHPYSHNVNKAPEHYRLTHPHNTQLRANYVNIDPVDIDGDCPDRWHLCVALVHILCVHLEGREGPTNMAVLGHSVGAVAHEGVIMAIKGVVEVAHDPAGT